MAGPQKVKVDPAIMKMEEMRRNRYKYFRWTPRTVRITVMYMVVVPTILGVIGYRTDGKWNLRGKRRGDDIREF